MICRGVQQCMALSPVITKRMDHADEQLEVVSERVFTERRNWEHYLIHLQCVEFPASESFRQ